MAQGLVADVRGVASDAVRMVRTRLELLGIELQEEKARIVQQVLVATATLFFAFLGMLLALLWLVLALPEEYRRVALGLLGLVFLGAAGACAAWLSRDRERPLFGSTVDALARDESTLSPGDD